MRDEKSYEKCLVVGTFISSMGTGKGILPLSAIVPTPWFLIIMYFP